MDLRHGNVEFKVTPDPLADTAAILLPQRIYADPNYLLDDTWQSGSYAPKEIAYDNYHYRE